MGRSVVFMVSDDFNMNQKIRTWAQENSADIHVYSASQWNNGISNPEFQGQIRTGQATLSPGAGSLGGGGAKVLQFPSQGSKRVASMNEVESDAIRNAIFEYKGNLTEAAKALGIGRATLYRKVKQYNIDPSAARNKAAKAA